MGDDATVESARRWQDDLEAWAIPPEILAAAPESPWGCPTDLFALAAEEAVATTPAERSPSQRRALEVLPHGGSILDVGAGGGAASLPLCPPGASVTAVDQSAGMLAAFAKLAERRGVAHAGVEGLWPDVAGEVGPADVVVCHHVLYNVGHLVPFVAALTDHARLRVVVEITAVHPQSLLNPLWEHFYGVVRPTRPGAEDAAAVLRDLGLDVGVEEFPRPALLAHADRKEQVAFARRRLCLPAERDDDVDAVLDVSPGLRPHATLWWAGSASG